MQRLERALRGLDGLERVELGEARQRRHVLVDLGVVLHRARAEGIEAVVHAVDALAEGGVMAGELIFAHVGQVQRLAALFGELIFGDVTLRHEGHAAAFDAKFKNELHLQHLLHDGDSFVELRLGDELRHAPEDAALDLRAAEDALCFERVEDLPAAVGAFDLGDELVEEILKEYIKTNSWQ